MWTYSFLFKTDKSSIIETMKPVGAIDLDTDLDRARTRVSCMEIYPPEICANHKNGFSKHCTDLVLIEVHSQGGSPTSHSRTPV